MQKVKLNVPKKINLNFVGGMTIEQTFDRAPDGTRIITKDDINVDFKLTEKSKGMYARRLNIYSNQAFEGPDDPKVLRRAHLLLYRWKLIAVRRISGRRIVLLRRELASRITWSC